MTVFRGNFLTSSTPEKTARFYREVAGVDLEEIGDASFYRYWKSDKNGMQLAIHDAEKFSDYTFPVCADSNVTHLYFHISDHAEFLEHLRELKLEPYATDEVVITVVDLDGRKVMFGTA